MVTSAAADEFGPVSIGSFAELALVRQQLARWLLRSGDLGAGTDLDDVLVVVSELGSNALSASPPDRPASLTARLSHGRLAIEVTNRVDQDVSVNVEVHTGDPLRSRGRGLLLVRALSDDVAVDAEGDQVTVCATMRVASDGRAVGSKRRRRRGSRGTTRG